MQPSAAVHRERAVLVPVAVGPTAWWIGQGSGLDGRSVQCVCLGMRPPKFHREIRVPRPGSGRNEASDPFEGSEEPCSDKRPCCRS